MYEMFEHTADLGLRVSAPDLDTLFAEAGQALFSAIVEELATVQALQPVSVDLAGTELAYLLFDWLNELLFQYESEHVLLSRFDVHVSESGLQGTVWGEPLDPGRHELQHEVKAITYHQLRVERTPDGWLAEVIVDI